MDPNLSIPLVVDLDGTLIKSDLLVESGVAVAKTDLLACLRMPIWLAGGKAKLKANIARRADIEVGELPYNDAVLCLMRTEHQKGRSIVLASASDQRLVQQVADELGMIDLVMASDGQTNLRAENKADALISKFGAQGFDYIGDSQDDLPVWAACRQGHVVGAGQALLDKVRRLPVPVHEIEAERPTAGDWLRAMRIQHWAKNLLIFAPLFSAHRLDEPGIVVAGLLAFLSFGLCASAVYLLNDLIDASDDRRHPTKRLRPIAAGIIPIKQTCVAVPVLLALSFAPAVLFFPAKFLLVLGTYFLVTLIYSVRIKRLMALDVIVLASLYTLRIIAGAAACALPLTFWILGFSMFLFLSLAFVKRHAELLRARDQGSMRALPGRGYDPGDLPMIASLGATSGYLSALVLALYVNDVTASALYAHPKLIWLAIPVLLLWLTRVWLITHRGHMRDDPVQFAIRDRPSLLMGLMFGAVFVIAA